MALPRTPLITPPALPPRQNKKLFVALGCVAAVVAAGGIVLTMRGQPPIPPREDRQLPVSEQTVMGRASTPPDDLRLPASYVRLPIPTAEPAPVQNAAPIPGATVQPASTTGPGMAIPEPPIAPPPLTPPPRQAASSPPSNSATRSQTAAVSRPTPPQPERAARWFSTPTPPTGDVLLPPLPDDPKETEKAERPSKLFPRAVWEKPADPYKVLYADQLVQTVLIQNVNSDIPGTFRLKTIEPAMDRWGHGHEVIPVDTVFLGRQEGQANFGQERIPAKITMAILPNGTAIDWTDGQVGDAQGANGMPADVNNHYLKLFMGVGLSAVLNIGVRAPFGSPGVGQYQPNLPQEFAEQATQGINQQGQTLLRQQFAVKPTLTQDFAYPVTIQFTKNVSFMTKPVVVTK